MVPHVKALFIINERSGTKRSYDVADLIRRESPFKHEIAACALKEDLDAIIDRAERESIDVVFAVGGDGTVHETAKRLIGTPLALGVLPIGSGNGFARHIGLGADPAAALRSCRGGRIVTIDTASVNGHPFLGVMGIGFDAVIANRFAASSVRGLQTYVREGLHAFMEFKAEEYQVTANGTTTRKCAFVIAVANSGQYGNNARIAPLASLQDGLLDLVIVDDTHFIDAAFLITRLFTGSFHRAAGVTSVQTTEVTIRRTNAGPAHLDGEPITLGEDLHVRVVPQSLRLLVPDSATAF
ncbi:MAG: YegS/Rv2252/BmrU family lipid kinase [Acidobacteriota bacterium]|nr:YegS/Rv2252/BmrU family lipid kinase [Acidobacteriota bacterium]